MPGLGGAGGGGSSFGRVIPGLSDPLGAGSARSSAGAGAPGGGGCG